MWEKKAILSVTSHRIQLWCYLRILEYKIQGRAEDPRFRKQQPEKMSLFNLNAVSLSVSLYCGFSLVAEEIHNHSRLLLSLSNQLCWEEPHLPPMVLLLISGHRRVSVSWKPSQFVLLLGPVSCFCCVVFF